MLHQQIWEITVFNIPYPSSTLDVDVVLLLCKIYYYGNKLIKSSVSC